MQMRDVWSQPTGYGRNQMLYLGEALELGQVGHGHRAVFAEPAKVVAE